MTTDPKKTALEICNRALSVLPEGVAGYGLFKDIKTALTAPAVPKPCNFDALAKAFDNAPHVWVTIQSNGQPQIGTIEYGENERYFSETTVNAIICAASHQPDEDSLPCVCCGKPAETSTPDDADMCHECFGRHNAAEYDNLRKRFEELIQRDYPDADIEDALDPCRPLPDSPVARLQAENEVMTEALLYYASPETYEDAFDRFIAGQGWQDIRSAPIGEHIIVSDGENVCQSFYGKISHVPIYGWLNLFCDPENLSLLEWTPTHWLALPEPPK